MPSTSMFERRMVALRVPLLLEHLLTQLEAQDPTNAAGVLRIVERLASEEKRHYFQAVVDEFTRHVDCLGTQGLPQGYPIFFSVPLADGSNVELFPGGSVVSVTSHNVLNFMSLLAAYRRSNPYRYTDYPEQLPLNAVVNLDNNFQPILDILEKEIAKWKLDSETWNELDVTWCVPRNGLIVDISQDKNHTVRVPHSELLQYVQAARAVLSGSPAVVNDAPNAAQQRRSLPEPSPMDTAATVLAVPPAAPQGTTAAAAAADVVSIARPPEELPSKSSASDTLQHYANFQKYVKAIFWANKGIGITLDEASFKTLDVHYCIPVMGKMVPLIPNGCNVLVPLSEKDTYCRLAAEKLGFDLEEGLAESVLLAADKKPSQLVGLLSPRNYQFDLFATPTPVVSGPPSGAAGPPTSSEATVVQQQQQTQARTSSSTTTVPTRVLTPDEILFHFKIVLRQLVTGNWTEADMKGFNLKYEIPVNGTMIPLVENGDKIPVTLENKDDFAIRALKAINQVGGNEQQQQLQEQQQADEEKKVLTLFSPSHFEADLFAPYVPSSTVNLATRDGNDDDDVPTDEKNFWDMLEVLHNGYHPYNLSIMNLKYVLKFPNGRIVELQNKGHDEVVSQGNLLDFIEAAKARREAIHLAFKYSEDDLDPILQFPKERAQEINKRKLTLEDIECCKLFDMIDGLAQLGSEDFERVKIMYCIPLSKEDDGKYDLVPDGRNIPVTFKYRDDFISRVVYERDRVRREFAAVNPGASLGGANSSLTHRRSITTIPLTAKQVATLTEFRDNVRLLGDIDYDEKSWNDLQLAWCIRFDVIVVDIIPDGSTKPVAFSQKNEYIQKCVAKCNEMLADQEERQAVVVPQAAQEEMGLFSPTHFEQDLFAPAQHITTKVTTSGAAATQVTPVVPSFVPTPPRRPGPTPAVAAPPQETLAQFLQACECSSLLSVLKENCVETVSHLKELESDDIVAIVPQVLLRRRLLNALANVR